MLIGQEKKSARFPMVSSRTILIRTPRRPPLPILDTPPNRFFRCSRWFRVKKYIHGFSWKEIFWTLEKFFELFIFRLFWPYCLTGPGYFDLYARQALTPPPILPSNLDTPSKSILSMFQMILSEIFICFLVQKNFWTYKIFQFFSKFFFFFLVL